MMWYVCGNGRGPLLSERFLRDIGLDTKTVVVFFLGRLTERRRRDIAARAGERELALVVLDEVLLAFLARLDDTRLPAFLRCSLPYAALNPYTPFQAGNVPPEMFYGRDKMVRQLQNEVTASYSVGDSWANPHYCVK